MKIANTLILCAAALTASLAAQAAGVQAVDVPRISNGGTGFIGVTDSAHAPRMTPTSATASVSRTPMQAGEASTMVNGQPNGNPDAPTLAAAPAAAGAPMGAISVMGAGSDLATQRHPMWGTPD